MILQRKTGKDLSKPIDDAWDTPPKILLNEDELLKKIKDLLKDLSLLIGYDRTNYQNENDFLKIFNEIKTISHSVTGKDWQEVINTFHIDATDKFTSFDKYTPDLLYRGSCYVNFGSLLDWISKLELELPRKRIAFIERLSDMQAK
jgi:hypothetical protein